MNIFNFSQLRRVFGFALPYKKKLINSIILAIVLALMAPVRPLLIQYTINQIIPNGVVYFLVMITLVQVGILIIETVFRFYFTFLTSWLGQTVVKDMRTKVYEKVLHLNLRQFDKTPIGTLTTRTINDIESINDIFSEGLIPIIADFLSIVAVLAAMLYINWQLTLICLIPFPFLIIPSHFL